MPRFVNFLVCAGEASGDAAAKYAARLAAVGGASITLADVFETVPPAVLRQLPEGWDVPRLIRDRKTKRLERTAAAVRRLGVTPKVTLLEGRPVDALVDEVERGGFDLVVAGTPSDDTVNAGRATASRLVRQCPCPVLLVRSTRHIRKPRVVVAVDANPLRGSDVDALTRRLIASALWITDLMKGELHVMNAWDSFGEGQMRRAGVRAEGMRHYRMAAQRDASQELVRILEPFADRVPTKRLHLEKGDPREAIPSFATRHKFDLLVIGTVGRSGLSRLIIGNTAEAVLHKIPCSMLVVRPERS